MAEGKIRKAHCSICRDERNCDVVTEYDQRGGDEDFQWSTEWYILKCRGCDNVFVQTVATNSEDYDNFYEQDGSVGTEYAETISYWPTLSKRTQPEWLKQFSLSPTESKLLDTAIAEVYVALNCGLPMLAAIGIRTSFDIAAVQLGANEAASFADKIQQLVETGKITEADRRRIAQLVDAGGASAHRGWVPSPNELDAMMDILEHFIELSIVEPKRKEALDLRAAALKAAVPPRQK